MPLPSGPPPPKPMLVRKTFHARRDHPDLQMRPVRFAGLEYVLYDKDIRKSTGLACRVCLRFQQCIQGPQQQFRCFAYWLWGEQSTLPDRQQKLQYLKTLPLTEATLAPLTVEELLGIFYVQRYSFSTIIDFSLYGLRQRLMQISQENSPYLLTTG